MLGLEAQGLATQAGIEEAIELFKRSLAIDPNFSRAWTNLSWAYLQLRAWIGNTPDLEKLEKEAASRAVELDPLDGNAHAALAEAYGSAGNTEQTKSEYDKALDLNPNSADILSSYAGWASTFGQSERGVEAAERALRLNPNAPTWTYVSYRWAFLIAGQYDDALAMHQRRPRDSYGRADFVEGATILAAVGHQKDADTLAQEASRRFQDISIEAYVSGASPNPTERQRLAEAMKKAGFPFCARTEELKAFPDMQQLSRCQP